jgi:putative transposase
VAAGRAARVFPTATSKGACHEERQAGPIFAAIYYYNNCRYHESLNNLTPADIYFGRAESILARRQKIKRKTIELRRQLRHQAVA